jgi:hypothetical protein
VPEKWCSVGEKAPFLTHEHSIATSLCYFPLVKEHRHARIKKVSFQE